MKGGLTGKRKGLVVFLVVCGLVAGGLGWVTAAVQASNPPQPWPTTTASGAPSDRTTPATSAARVSGS